MDEVEQARVLENSLAMSELNTAAESTPLCRYSLDDAYKSQFFDNT